ncbi:MAG: hypothetical protein ACYCT1_08210 [Steroidobacteraceae bacterium]
MNGKDELRAVMINGNAPGSAARPGYLIGIHTPESGVVLSRIGLAAVPDGNGGVHVYVQPQDSVGLHRMVCLIVASAAMQRMVEGAAVGDVAQELMADLGDAIKMAKANIARVK